MAEKVTAFDKALEKTLGYEGGYSNHPLDRGGPTHAGFTQRIYDLWRDRMQQARRPVDQIEEHEKVSIAREEFWIPCNCDQLPEALAIAVFDMAFNSGTWNAKLTLQRALMVRADGVIGPVTLLAARTVPDAVLRFLKRRAAFIQEIIMTRPDQIAFLEGWVNRLLDQAWRGA